MTTPLIRREAMQPATIPAMVPDEMVLDDWADAESMPVLLGVGMVVDPNTGSPLDVGIMLTVVDEGPVEEEPEELRALAAVKNCSKVPFPVVLGFSAKTIPGRFLMKNSSKA
jgi:hypothetical protein